MSQQNTNSNPVKPMKIGGMTNASQFKKESKNKMSMPIKEMRYGEKTTPAYKIPKAGKSNGAGWGGEKPVLKSTMKKAVKKAGLPSKMKVMKSISKSMGY
jgi:hypothetical protein